MKKHSPTFISDFVQTRIRINVQIFVSKFLQLLLNTGLGIEDDQFSLSLFSRIFVQCNKVQR